MFGLTTTARLIAAEADATAWKAACLNARVERDDLQAKVDRMTGGLRQNRSKAAAKGGV